MWYFLLKWHCLLSSLSNPIYVSQTELQHGLRQESEFRKQVAHEVMVVKSHTRDISESFSVL